MSNGLPPGLTHWSQCRLHIPSCDLEGTPFNYRPSLPANAFFLAFFAVSILGSAGMMVKFKTWNYSIVLIVGCAMELVGYVGRVMAYNNPWDENAFLIQICCLTIAPVFFAAAIYFCLSRIVTVYGGEHSRIPPVAYTWIFLTADIVSLILQAAGGAIASTAPDDDEKAMDNGNKIMIAGLFTQVVTLLAFIAICTDFFIRVQRRRRAGLADRSSGFWQRTVLLISLAVATVCILIRSIFRVAELWEGWNGELMSHQGIFIGLEGVLLVVAVACLMIFNPGWGFRDGHVWRFGDVSLKKFKRNKETKAESASSTDVEA